MTTTICPYCRAAVPELAAHYCAHPRAGGCVYVAAAFDKNYSVFMVQGDGESLAEFSRRRLAAQRDTGERPCAKCGKAERVKGKSYCHECVKIASLESWERNKHRYNGNRKRAAVGR